MSKWYETKKFKELASEWDKKLEQSGFEDAEKLVGKERVLRQRSDHPILAHNRADVKDLEVYFQLLEVCVREEKWVSQADKLILTRHSEGKKIKEISKELEELGYKSHRQTVRFAIRKYENKWKIKKWKPNQLKAKVMKPKVPTA